MEISFPYASSLAVGLISWVTCFSSSALLPSPGADPEKALKEKVWGGKGDLICITEEKLKSFTKFDGYVGFPIVLVGLEVFCSVRSKS